MAWTNIVDKVVGNRVRAIDFNSLKDNISALAAGLSGAPKIQADALDSGSVEYSKCESGLVPPYMSSGTTYPFLYFRVSPPDVTPETLYKSFGVIGAGSFSFKYLPPADPSGTVTINVYINSVLVRSTAVTNNVQYGWFTESFSTDAYVEIKAIGASATNYDVDITFSCSNFQSITRFLLIDNEL